MPTPPLPELRVSLPEAREKITAQIKRGREIRDSVRPIEAGGLIAFGSEGAFERARIDQEKWGKYTIDLLKSYFSGESIANEFGDWFFLPHSVHYDLKRFVNWMEIRIVRLESILERLDFFPIAERKAEVRVAQERAKPLSKDIFIVHGHDVAAKHEVARFIEKLGLHPIILHEQADRGRTVIEKFEAHADVGFAVVLLTPDDMGYPEDKPSEAKPRARQNVVLELGYFSGILGRANVCALLKGDIEIPSDYAGVLYTPMDNAGAWKVTLAREINAAGIDVDLKKLL